MELPRCGAHAEANLGRGLLLLADPAAEASREGAIGPLRVRPTLYDPAALEAALSA
jgi:hypothetical protein